MKFLQRTLYPFVDDGSWSSVGYALGRLHMKANRLADERQPLWRRFFD